MVKEELQLRVRSLKIDCPLEVDLTVIFPVCLSAINFQKRERERERERQRETDRQTDRQRQRQRERREGWERGSYWSP